MEKSIIMETFAGYKKMCDYYESKGYHLVSINGYCNHTYIKYYLSSIITEYVNISMRRCNHEKDDMRKCNNIHNENAERL